MWTLDSAVELVRALQLDAWRSGHFMAIGGGVLNRGASKKDLDIICMPASHGGDRALPDLLSAFDCAGFSTEGDDAGHEGVTVYKLLERTGAKRQIDLIVPTLATGIKGKKETPKSDAAVRAGWRSGW